MRGDRDNDGATSGPTSGSTQTLEHRGAVLVFTYTPARLASDSYAEHGNS
jgi:hypothetical protein